MQTNFEEEKEKDETIEIQSHRQMLLDSQYQLADLLKAQISALDEWKESEKKRYEKETEEIKSSFQEAFNFMSQKRRIVLNKTKLDLYSIPAENARPEKQTNELREQPLSNEWEKKYKDLEINYKDSYEKMSFILSKLDKKNKDQLLLIEELRKKPETRNFSIQVNLNKIHSSKASKTKIEEFPKEELVISNPVSDKVLIRKPSKENISRNIKRTRNEVLEIINSKMHDVGLKPNQSCIKTEDFEKIKLKIDHKRKEKIRKFCNFQTTRENILHSLNFDMQNFTKDYTTHDEELSNKILQKYYNLNKLNYDVGLFDDTNSSGRIFDKTDGSSQESRDKKLTKNKKVNFDCDKNEENDEISFYDKYLESRKNMYQISTDTDNE
uniref:Cilium assembly protein DZIP1 domain-containing protein n=2 Tax=Lutzomyia longipalpis TaxID=7200 RepID=A0A1B0GIV4_LUTLO